jgi:2-methylisocitrate lyase-like PEP mutase family enzyme
MPTSRAASPTARRRRRERAHGDRHGVAGLSIEDSTGDPNDPLRALDDAVARMRAARAAIDAAGGDTLLVGRAENFFVGRPDSTTR